MRIISLGWGVQSFGLAAMSALGVLPPVDAAVHADTGHERSKTYEFAARWTPWLEEHAVRVVTVQGGRPPIGTDGNKSKVSIPAYTRRLDGRPLGLLRRQCTHDWKIMPVRRWLQANRSGESVEQWLGITADEMRRMKPSGVKHITNVHPYIEMLDRPWRRGMVIHWLIEQGLEVPVKSSCIFCPYHDRATWREIQLGGDGDWEKAVEVDRAIRHSRPGYLCYLTPEREPLDECDFSSQEERGQLALW